MYHGLLAKLAKHLRRRGAMSNEEITSFFLGEISPRQVQGKPDARANLLRQFITNDPEEHMLKRLRNGRYRLSLKWTSD